MSPASRREFLTSSALAAGAGWGAWPQSARAADETKPSDGLDLVVLRGTVYTVDDRRPSAEAFAVKNGRIIAVGTTAEIQALTSRSTKIIDAGGQTIVPGFIDAHSHPADSGISELIEVDCNRRTIAEIKDALRKHAAKSEKGEWVFGFKYDDTKLKDGRPLNRADLDEAVPDHPVRVVHRGGHTAVVNSAALAIAKINRDTPDPAGGKYIRDDKGELTGLVAETALEVINKSSRQPAATPKQRQAGVKLMSELMTAAGLTTVHDAQASKEDLVAYQDALAAGEMLFRVHILARQELFNLLVESGIRPGFGNDRLRISGLKLLCDGSASERTMRMSTPFIGRPKDYGILVMPQEELNEAVRTAHALGFQVGVHANGDVAIDMVLTAYERALQLHPRKNPRHRIEHCTLINPVLLTRIAALDCIPTPFYTYVYYHGDKWEQYGDEKTRSMFAHRSFLDHKINVAGASDYVPGPFEPLMAIQSMVTRQDYRGKIWGENQRITVPEALRICTLNGAYASFDEQNKGSITPGKLADFVMLAKDPHKVPANEIKDIAVVRTVVDGYTVFEKT